MTDDPLDLTQEQDTTGRAMGGLVSPETDLFVPGGCWDRGYEMFITPTPQKSVTIYASQVLEARQNVINAIIEITALLDIGAKSLRHFEKVIVSNVKLLHSGRRDAADFVDRMAALIEDQLRVAWNDGMRANDLDPRRDMKPEWEAILQDLIAEEWAHIESFAAAIELAAAEEKPVDGLLSRAQLWVNRYHEVVNLSKLTTRPKDRFVWRLGKTEEHCETCFTLNGVVATAADWAASGYRPQGRNLKCGGWHCDCRVEYTEEPTTKGGIPKA